MRRAPAWAAVAGALLAAAAAQAEPVSYSLDPTHTFATFEFTHMGLSTTRVRFDRKEGSIQIDWMARTGRIDIGIDMASVNSGVAVLDAVLKKPGNFDVAAHPMARFVAERLQFEGERLTAVGGELTLAGQTRPLTLKARRFSCYLNPLFKRQVCGGDFEATLQRSQWGLDQGLQSFASDEVQLLVQVEAVRQ
jgi:polyisoprenoid-binding protein YceI